MVTAKPVHSVKHIEAFGDITQIFLNPADLPPM